MTEELHIIRARAEEDRWDEIERQIAEWDRAELSDDVEPDTDPEIETLLAEHGY
ncbi:MAG: hypothetical protein GKS00_01975 [Alphaproteobacteria bacterium]|nr:hypothetical protein [Alphaproteobacteria bacterium]